MMAYSAQEINCFIHDLYYSIIFQANVFEDMQNLQELSPRIILIYTVFAIMEVIIFIVQIFIQF